MEVGNGNALEALLGPTLHPLLMHHNGCHLTPPLASSAPSAPALGGGVQTGADSEQAWPQSSGEEDLQLQLALAMSKEEAEQVKSRPLRFSG